MTLKPQNSLIRPVFTQEFYHEVKRAWRLRVGQNGKENALPRNIDLNVKAFIVDHKAREKSTDEALKVAGWIKSMGLKSQVLTLQWPEGTKDPARLPNFETLARRLRYQALGTACVTENIRALFLGHHRDDNVETALLRLAQGHGRFGLAGFDSVSPIPECHSLWGVSQSGDITSIEAISADRTPRMAPIKPNLMNNEGARAPLPQPDSSLYTATGGVYIFRPFRSFQRHDWKLLAALQGSHFFLKLVRVINFDFSSGTLLVRLPFAEEVDFFKETFNDPHQDHPHINPFDVQLKVVRTLIELVTPESDLQVSQEGLVRAAKLLWPRSSEDTSSPDVFTLGGVQFQPQKRKGKYGVFPHSFKRRSQDALIAFQNLRGVADNPTDPNIWLLSREPLRRHLPPPITKFGICLPDPVPEQINKAGWQSVNEKQVDSVGNSGMAHIYSFGDTIQVTMKPMSQEDVVGIRRSELGNPFYQRRSSWKLTDRDLRPESYPGGRSFDASRWKKKAFDVLLSCFVWEIFERQFYALGHSTAETIPTEEGRNDALPIWGASITFSSLTPRER
ncbi:tRNA(Ile)-lysidine synthetase family protein [Coccidioides immitis RMSCC 3703]|uniref:tRNA(Ile)-lysidine synthetase n=1 Tax=Coccidioides immitis RMSCC 3703 TaxID=454286 RepID=A0A0J8R230_COCIT|nr:tRNA(Ile)-lysidine synthetase family protein [Coccidioides immitis RMSCC 3703]